MDNDTLNQKEKEIFQRAKPYLSESDNVHHTQDVIEFALKLLATEKGDRYIVIPAAILHDVGWCTVPEDVRAKVRSPGRDISLAKAHEVEGAKIAKEILNDILSNDSQVAEILEIINGHDTRDDAISLNDMIVKDADKLSRYSANFRSTCDWSGLTPQELSKDLEEEIEKWFFCSASRRMAKEELSKRKSEI